MRRSNKQIAKIAYDILAKYGIRSPHVDVRKISEELDIAILPSNLGEDISGVLAFKPTGPVIGVNSTESEKRKRFTIAHELGHYVLGHGRDGIFIDNFKLYRDGKAATGEEWKEREANAFAAALLMPELLVREEFHKLSKGKVDLKDENAYEGLIDKLAEIFQVSRLAMSIRVGNLMLFEAF